MKEEMIVFIRKMILVALVLILIFSVLPLTNIEAYGPNERAGTNANNIGSLMSQAKNQGAVNRDIKPAKEVLPSRAQDNVGNPTVHESEKALPSRAQDNVGNSTVFESEKADHERVIITFKDLPNKQLVEQAKGVIHREYTHINALSISVPVQAIQGLRNNPNVIDIEQDVVVLIKQTEDWGIARTNAPAAWNSSYTGEGVRIAIIDTGIANHADLLIAGGVAFTSYTNSYQDDNGHGTHVAGIIGARNNSIGTVGIAHQSSLYAVKALDYNGAGYLSDVIAGIDWSITNRMDIINMSLGTTSHSTSMQQMVDKAYSQGILVVAAAGNNGNADGIGDTINYPARYSSVIAVGAIDANDRRASFSATGSTLEFTAPGVSILSTYTGDRYVRLSGTSMASPYTAGNLALLKQAHPNLTNQQLRAKLQELTVDLGESGRDNWFGYGLIQAPVSDHETLTPVETNPISVTVASSNQSTYTVGDTVTITVKVSSSAGLPLAGTDVRLSIRPPKGRGYTAINTTGVNGEIAFNYATKSNSPIGTYLVKVESSPINHEHSSTEITFQMTKRNNSTGSESTKGNPRNKSSAISNINISQVEEKLEVISNLKNTIRNRIYAKFDDINMRLTLIEELWEKDYYELEDLATMHILRDEFEIAGQLDDAIALQKLNINATVIKGEREPYIKLGELLIKNRNKDIHIFIDGETPDLDANSFIKNGRTLVPVRAIAEMLGTQVQWDSISKKVTLKRGEFYMELFIDQKVAMINGILTSIDVAPKIVNGRTFLPLRFVSEQFDAGIEWLADSKIIIIESNK